jgi:hypothetical protein
MRAHDSCHGRVFRTFFVALPFGQFDARQNQQVVRDDIAPDIAPESAPPAPGAVGQAKTPLQGGDIGLDPDAKVLQTSPVSG